MTGSCLKCLPLPILLKTHDMYYKALDYKDLSDLVPAYVTNFITCHSLSLIMLQFTIVLYHAMLLLALGPLHSLFSVPGTVSTPHSFTSSPSSLSLNVTCSESIFFHCICNS